MSETNILSPFHSSWNVHPSSDGGGGPESASRAHAVFTSEVKGGISVFNPRVW